MIEILYVATICGSEQAETINEAKRMVEKACRNLPTNTVGDVKVKVTSVAGIDPDTGVLDPLYLPALVGA